MHGTLEPYIGIGLRYFEDEGKDHDTNLGYYAYDRRIAQGYAPIGLTYVYTTAHNFTITPNFEYDPLIRGDVDSRLTNGGYPYDISNIQHYGYGLRGSLMFGYIMHGIDVEAGPFIRYWKFDDSNISIDPAGNGWVEPENWRSQIGLALKAVW